MTTWLVYSAIMLVLIFPVFLSVIGKVTGMVIVATITSSIILGFFAGILNRIVKELEKSKPVKYRTEDQYNFKKSGLW